MKSIFLNNIFKIESYGNAPATQKPEKVETLEHLKTLLNTDNNLNETYYGEDIIKIIIDFEKEGQEPEALIKELKNYFKTFLNKNIIFSMTSNYKKFNNVGSYHIIIKNLSCKVSHLRYLIKDYNLKVKNPLLELDDTIYKDGRNIVRLPNQTTYNPNKKEWKHGHRIMKGDLIDFYALNTEGAEDITDDDYIKSLLQTPQPSTHRTEKPKKTDDKKEMINFNKYDVYKMDVLKTENNKNYIEKLKLFTPDFLDVYINWIKLGAIIKSLEIENGVEIYDELSKKSSKYKPNEPAQKFKTFYKHLNPIAALIYLLKSNYPEEYDTLNNNIVYDDIQGTTKYKTIQYNQEYLIDNDDDKFLLNHFDKFYNDDNIKSFSIKSTYNTGKTKLIKKLIQDYNPKKILFISYRKTLSYDLEADYKTLDVYSYLDGKYKANRLIIQLESLFKILENDYTEDGIKIPKYNWIIIDEIESILNHFMSSTFKGNEKFIFNLLFKLCKHADKVISLDGDWSNRAFKFLEKLGEQIIIENTIKKNIKHFDVVQNEIKFMNSIFDDINDNKKIVITSMSATQAEKYYSILCDKYQTKKIYLYTGLTDDELKEEHFKHVEKYFDMADVLIYSSTLESGVNYNKKRYFKIYGIFSTQGTSQRGFFQMIARVRQVANNNIMILNENIKEKHSACFYNYDEVKAGYTDFNFKKDIKYLYFDDDDDKIKKPFDLFDNNYIYNQVEEKNKNQTYFTALFYQMAIRKGHSVNFENLAQGQKGEQKTKKEMKEEKQKIKDEQLIELKPEDEKYYNLNKDEFINDKIINSKTLNEHEIKMIYQKHGTSKQTKEEKLQILKYKLIHKLGLDDLNIEALKMYKDKEHLIYNFLGLIDDNNIINKPNDENEEEESTRNKLKEENTIEKHYIIKNLIHDLGYINIFDNKGINYDDFNNNLLKVQTSNIIFKDFENTRIKFNLSKEPKQNKTENNRSKIIYINSLLNRYSLKISTEYLSGKSKINKNQVYKLHIINNIQEIIEYRQLKNKTFEDKDNIFKPLEDDKKIFKSLFIVPEIKTENNNDMFNDE